MRPRSSWRRAQLVINITNLAVSLTMISGGLWAWLGERGWPAPAVVVRVYSPMLAALRWYDSVPLGAKTLGTLIAVFSLVFLLACYLFSFKAHLEEVAVILLGMPLYLVIALVCFCMLGLAVALIRLLPLLTTMFELLR